MIYEKIPDHDLVSLTLEGDQLAFSVLFQKYQPKLLRYAMRFVYDPDIAEESVQEIFLKVYANLHSYDHLLGTFNTWIYRIAYTTLVTIYNSRKKHRTLSLDDEDSSIAEPADPIQADTRYKRRHITEQLNHHLDQLPQIYADVLVLLYFKHLSYSEISERLNIPVSTVGIRLQRGRKRLAAQILAAQPSSTSTANQP
jgi:RNA polymerase sigma-70 factor, ECF subfamily